MRVFTWPEQLPSSLDGFFATVRTGVGDAEFVPLRKLDELAAARSGGEFDALLIVFDAALTSGESTVGEAVDGIRALATSENLNVVVVVSDGFLGTDVDDLSAATGGAGAVAAVRSIAVRRGVTSRANVVCVPAALFGDEGSQRGPIPQPVECRDVAEAATFFLDDANTYLNGQVLFVNGGRHLFSSLSA